MIAYYITGTIKSQDDCDSVHLNQWNGIGQMKVDCPSNNPLYSIDTLILQLQ